MKMNDTLLVQIGLKEKGKILFGFTQVNASFMNNVPIAWPKELDWIGKLFSSLTFSFDYSWWYCRYDKHV